MPVTERPPRNQSSLGFFGWTDVKLRTIDGHSDEVLGVALTNDGRRAVSASVDHTLKLWELETGAALAAFTCDASTVSCVFVDDYWILAGDAGGHVHFLRLEEPKCKD